jgi:hypothetical protein
MRVIRDGEVLYSSASGCGASNADDCGCGCNEGYSNNDGLKNPFQQSSGLNTNLYTTDFSKRGSSTTSGGSSSSGSSSGGTTDSTTTSGKKPINPDLLSAGADIFTQLGTALIGRQRTYTDVEQKCGKKPKTGKKAKEAWQKCASSADLTPSGAPIATGTSGDEAKPGLSKGAKIGIAVGGLVVVGLVIFLVAKSGKSKGK